MSERKRSKRSTKSAACSGLSRVVTPADIGLPAPGLAVTRLPEALGSRYVARRLGAKVSAYAVTVGPVSPVLAVVGATYAEAAPFIERSGDNRAAIIKRLVSARAAVRNGEKILDAVADGTLEGWHARMAIARHCPAANLVAFDGERYRTKLERLAVLEKTLVLLGYVEPKRRGGWAVSS